MAVVTSQWFNSMRGKLQNLVVATQPDGRIVIRSRPFQYRERNDATRKDNKACQAKNNLIAKNYYATWILKYFAPYEGWVLPYSCFVGRLNIMASYYADLYSQPRASWTVPQLANSNFSFVNNARISFSFQSFLSLTVNSSGRLDYTFTASTSTPLPNDRANDQILLCIINLSNQRQFSQSVAGTRADGFYSFFANIQAYTPEDDYIIIIFASGTNEHFFFKSQGYIYAYIQNGIISTVEESNRHIIFLD